MLDVDGDAEGFLARGRCLALVVEQVQHAVGRRFDEREARPVVEAARVLAKERLDQVVVELGALEDVAEVERVHALVGVVDAQLLEAVGLERLEAEDVEQSHLP